MMEMEDDKNVQMDKGDRKRVAKRSTKEGRIGKNVGR
jgi:hypothetical protein